MPVNPQNLVNLIMGLQQQANGSLPPTPMNQPGAMPAPQVQAPAMNAAPPSYNFKASVKSAGPSVNNYAGQMDNLFAKQMGQREQEVARLEQERQKLAGQESGFQDMNLKPLLAFGDMMAGTNAAQSYSAPTGAQDRAKRVQQLQEAVSKGQSGMGDDQLAYLKQKHDEQRQEIQLQRMQASLSGKGDVEEGKIRSQYLAHPTVKNMYDISSAVTAIDQNPAADGPSQQALVYQFSKLLDPGSVVRETEYAISAANAGKISQAQNFFNRLQTGEMLTPEQVGLMKEVVKGLADSYRNNLNQTNTIFTELSKRKGINPANVVLDPYQNVGQKKTGTLFAVKGNERVPVLEADRAQAEAEGYTVVNQ
jgi:hypothetical protein